MNNEYAKKVETLLRMIPLVMEEGVFAVHGGSAINLFVRNMPRYSVDIDLTYIPVEDRDTSLVHINRHLDSIAANAKKAFPGMHIIMKPDISKLLCEYRGRQVKIEVNQTKRGIVGGDVLRMPVCVKAQEEFSLYCEADIVPLTLLYGGKIAAALSRQHPRDLFDVKYMEYPFKNTREGLLFCLLGSDRPIHESFAPGMINQHDALEKQFTLITQYLNIKTKLTISSNLHKNNDLKAEEKVIHICKLLNGTDYYNTIGGQTLYSQNNFYKENLTLHFLQMNDITYPQFKNQFIPSLSIIDVMMFNSPEQINQMLDKYELITPTQTNNNLLVQAMAGAKQNG